MDLDNLSRNQKKEIEKLEVTQNADLRTSSRKMKQDQVRFRSGKMLRQFKFSYVTIQVIVSQKNYCTMNASLQIKVARTLMVLKGKV